MNVDFELYKIFYYVAKHLSFSQAAAELFLSQSAVSQAIRQLEEKLACRLFNRNTKQVRLTPEGDLLFRHIEQAFHFIKAGERGIAAVRSLQQGEIHIGASDTICKYYLLPSFKQFTERYPGIKIKVTNRSSSVCLDLLGKGLIDVAVVNLPDAPAPVKAEKIRTLQDVFIAGAAFGELRGRRVPLRELCRYPLLMLEKHSVTRDFFDRLLLQNGITAVPEIELGSVDLLIALTKIGLGISFVTRDLLDRDIEDGSLFIVELAEHIPPRYLGVATNAAIPLSAAAERFIEILTARRS
ncbi:MAG: LysR family transcriptional regulator [Negativicutes bacterium]|nr:LysR family transcriptional regulator [Negativicutes bacterium]